MRALGNATDYDRSILRDGLMLSLVPSAVGTIFLLLVNLLWFDSSRLSERESNNTAVTTCANLVISDLIRYHTLLLTEVGGKTPKHGSSAETRAQLVDHLAQLKSAASKDSAYSAPVEPIIQIAQDACNLTKLRQYMPNDADDLMSRTVKQGQLGVAMIKTGFIACNQAMAMSEVNDVQLAQIRQQQDKFQAQLTTVAYAGFAGSFAIVFLLVLAFNLRFRQQLLQLVRDAQGLSKPDQPITPLPGHNEAAALSQALADLKGQLIEAAQRRQAIVEMVAHDVRSPLMAASVAVDFLVKTGSQTLSQAMLDLLSAAKNQLRETIGFANRLLEQERLPLEAPAPESPALGPVARRGMQIAQKVLLISMVPLLLQTAWLLWISSEISASNRLARAAQRQGEIVEAVNKALIAGVRAVSGTALFVVTKKPEFKHIALLEFDVVDQVISKLDAQLEPSAGNRAYFAQMRAVNSATRTACSQVEPTKITGDLGSQLAAFQDVQKLIAQAARANSQQQDLLRQQQLLLQTDQRNLSERQANVQYIIYAGCAANIFTGLLLMLFFSRNIESRVRALLVNVRAVACGNSVRQPVLGGDELALLDSALRAAGGELQNLAIQRRAVISALTDEMQLPLKTADENLETFQSQLGSADLSDREELSSARWNIDQVLHLLSDLMDSESSNSGVLSLSKRPTDLAAIAAEAASSVMPLAAGRSIVIDNSVDRQLVDADAQRIRQVLINLLSNAVKFSPQASRVTISSSTDERYAWLFVEDEGPGIAVEQAEKIFEGRVRLQAGVEGFGLGLSIAKAVIEGHGGIIGVKPARNGGSRFFLSLPLPPIADTIA